MKSRKICNKCGYPREIEEFSYENEVKDKRRGTCVHCQRENTKRHYNNNKGVYLDSQQKARIRIKKYLDDYKTDSGCIVCGENHIATLEFHHRDPREKEDNLTEAIRCKWSIARTDREIAKCDILCSNCHRKLHYDKRQLSVVQTEEC